MFRRQRTSPLFPYTTLFRSRIFPELQSDVCLLVVGGALDPGDDAPETEKILDRKSTRLNSSHLGISYAVFGLKKKTNFKELGLDIQRIESYVAADDPLWVKP